MSKLTKAKRNKLVVLCLATAVILSAMWQGVVEPQRIRLSTTLKQVAAASDSIKAGKRQASLTENLKADWENATQKIHTAESRMPGGDIYRWLGKTFREFESSNKVEIVTLDPPRVEDSSILPAVPYKAAIFMVTGRAYYDDFGRFVSRLESAFPHMRVRQLDLEPAVFGEASSTEEEKVAFKVELLALVRAGSTTP